MRSQTSRGMGKYPLWAFAPPCILAVRSWTLLLFFSHPTPKNILGVHWDMAKHGEILKYLAVNRTENSTTLWNYRQKECAFWTEYLPSVIGYITPTYPPTTEVQ